MLLLKMIRLDVLDLLISRKGGEKELKGLFRNAKGNLIAGSPLAYEIVDIEVNAKAKEH